MGTKADEIKLPLLIRFIKLGTDEIGSQLRLNIARYTNAQSPVIAPDFKSNEDEQEKIAHAFRLLSPPVYYERKRGQRNTLSRAEKRQYDNFITMVDVAQRWYAFTYSPRDAIVNKRKLFQESGTYKKIFNPPRAAAEYYISYLLFDQFGSLLNDKKSESQGKTDTKSLFFLELARSRNLVAAHLTHLVGEIIRHKYGELDLQTAVRLLEAVRERQIAEHLWDLLVVVLNTFQMSLKADEPLSKEWRNEETIEKLKSLLWQQVEVFSQVRINILDIV